jgi:hypothetical protein
VRPHSKIEQGALSLGEVSLFCSKITPGIPVLPVKFSAHSSLEFTSTKEVENVSDRWLYETQ